MFLSIVIESIKTSRTPGQERSAFCQTFYKLQMVVGTIHIYLSNINFTFSSIPYVEYVYSDKMHCSLNIITYLSKLTL